MTSTETTTDVTGVVTRTLQVKQHWLHAGVTAGYRKTVFLTLELELLNLGVKVSPMLELTEGGAMQTKGDVSQGGESTPQSSSSSS